jgi:hypothetical protein
MKWITPHAFHKGSLEEAQRQAVAEIARLDKLDTENDTLLSELYRTAWEKLEATTDDLEKKSILADAKENKLPEAYIEKLHKRAGLPEE